MHREELSKWLEEYYDKERKANFRKNIDDGRRRAAIMTKLSKEEPQQRYHDYIARRYRELEEK